VFKLSTTRGFKQYIEIAKRILENNWTGAYTRPSPHLYPHQWNWDSGFIALGYAHYNQKRAMHEMNSLFQSQWANGMVPQIVFNPDSLGHYFPEPDFWQVPGNQLTSGITMPPIHTIACLHIYQSAHEKKRAKEFLKGIYPKLMNAHRYLYRYRDPEHTGLVSIRHPWESGIDNSPAWDEALGRISIDKTTLPFYERKDTKQGVPAENRPKDDDYDRYVYLVDLFRRLKYREEDILRESPFKIDDVLFNSILCRANHDLLSMSRILGEDGREVEEWYGSTSRALAEKLWCPECERFEAFDHVAGKHIHAGTAASFMPLFAGAATESQAAVLYKSMNSVSFCALHQGNCFTIPNYDMTSEDFDPRNYWRGPVWLNINWMLSQGLKRYGYREKADAMKKDMLQLPIRFGFHEYFDSQTGTGYGSPDFSWTAALFLQLIYEYYDKDKHDLDWLNVRKNLNLRSRRILNKTSREVPNSPQDRVAGLLETIGQLKDKTFDLRRGLVDYKAIKGLDEYRQYQEMTSQLREFDLGSLSDPQERLSFWINLYNAIVVHGVIELEVAASVKEIPDFFTNIAYQIGKYHYSPDDMEHGILRANSRPPYRLRPLFGKRDPRLKYALNSIDPRIHFALVCASRSCAPIRFYESEAIEGQLEIAARNFINSTEVVIIPEENKIFLSQIFKWYRRDFGGREGILRYLLKYLEEDEKTGYLRGHVHDIHTEYLFYDWNLNH